MVYRRGLVVIFGIPLLFTVFCFDFNVCLQYELVPVAISFNVSDCPQGHSCISLSGPRATSNQAINYFCYEEVTEIYVSSYCTDSKLLNWGSYEHPMLFSCFFAGERVGDNKKCNNLTTTPCLKSFFEDCSVDPPSGNGCILQPSNAPSTSSSTALAPTTVASSTEHIVKCQQGLCPEGECFFKDCCYLIIYFQNGETNVSKAFSACAENGSLSQAVFLDTLDEESFVQEMLKGKDGAFLVADSFFHHWRAQNFQFNQTFSGRIDSHPQLVLISSTSGFSWEWKLEGSFTVDAVICERKLMWSTVLPELRQRCLRKYLENNCNGSFCCAVDCSDELWFECGSVRAVESRKPCPLDPANEMTWTCSDGNFIAQAPDTSACRCSTGCRTVYHGKRFAACPGYFAYAACPHHEFGYQRWFCLSNGSFEGPSPNRDLCCSKITPFRRLDQFLNMWVACPNTTATQITRCPVEPPMSQTRQAEVSWKCGPSGFLGPTPDYSVCSPCNFSCVGFDHYGQMWEACDGDVAEGHCPVGHSGRAFWACNHTEFVNPGPDFSDCYPDWVPDVEQMINEHVDAAVIMRKIHQKIDVEFGGVGLNVVLNVSSSCINLFAAQNNLNGSLGTFENFTAIFIEVVADLTENDSVWSQLQRGNSERIFFTVVEMAERIAFSLPMVDPELTMDYEGTFAPQANSAGVKMWIAYGKNEPSFISRENNVTVHLSSLQGQNISFAASGIVFPKAVANLALPVRLTEKIMNSALLSLTVIEVGAASKVPNVSMKVSFQHLARGRFPTEKVLRRRLHPGELPSPIIGSSQCFYFDTVPTPGEWVNSGCTLLESSADKTVCECQHLSSFIILVDTHEYEPNDTLETFTIICCVLSVIGLSLTLLVLTTINGVRLYIDKERALIGINRSLCLLIVHLLVTLFMDKKFFNISDGMCSAVAGVLHYVLMAAFLWMSVEGFHLYRLLVTVFRSELSHKSIYLIVGYIFPCIPVMLTELISRVLENPAYGRDELCWLKTEYIWSFDGPVIFLSAVNLIVIIIAIRMAVAKNNHASLKTWWVWCKGAASLSTLLGVTWLLALFFLDQNVPVAFEFIFVFLNGLQGVYIFIFQCFFNNQIRAQIFQLFSFGKRDPSSTSKKATVACVELETSGAAPVAQQRVTNGGGITVVRTPSDRPGEWLFKTNTPRREWVDKSNIVPCDDVLRKLHNRIINNINLELSKN